MAQQQRRMIGGRELLFYIVRFYSVREECGQTYLFKDLMQVTLGKDDNGSKLEPWFLRWQDVYHTMAEGPSPVIEKSIKETFEENLRNC
eukprot:11320261-Prorocentrum_lima.AAC.1